MQRASLLDGNPATKEAADQVRSFLRQIQRMQQISPELAARIEKAQVAVQRVEEQAYNGALGRFFVKAVDLIQILKTFCLNTLQTSRQ